VAVNLSIKDVPDHIAQRLRERAARHHRSLQGELMALVEQAAQLPQAAPHGGKSIVQIAAEHRALYPEPFAAAPRAVDLVRQARDSR
jgi:plasmid stability protein